MEVTSEQHGSSVCDTIAIKQEPVEAEPSTYPKQEIEYISVKEESSCLQKWEEPDIHDSAQDPLSIAKEECSPPEALIGPSTSSIHKTENEEDEEEPVSEDDCQVFKHEVESTGSGSELESTYIVGVEDDSDTDGSDCFIVKIPMAAGKDNSIQSANRKEASSGNKTGTMYNGRQAVKNPLRVHTGERPYRCSICNKTFVQSRHLKHHSHKHNDRCPYRCGVCNKTFMSNRNLKTHSLLHTGKRPYSCGICNRTFTQTSQLKHHSYKHTGKRPYSCGVCNKTFTQSGHLKEHSLLHTGERPYSCSVCKKTFTRSSTLKTHSQLHTGERPYRCDVCNKTFLTNSHLKNHLLLHNGDRHKRLCSFHQDRYTKLKS